MSGLRFYGQLDIKIFDKGILIEASTQHNMVFAQGIDRLIGSAFMPTVGQAGLRYHAYVDRVIVGEGFSDPESMNIAFVNPYIKNLDEYRTAAVGPGPTTRSTTLKFTLDETECNGMIIREIGLYMTTGSLALDFSSFTPSPGNDAPWSRIVRAPIVKTNTMSIEGLYTVAGAPLTA